MSKKVKTESEEALAFQNAVLAGEVERLNAIVAKKAGAPEGNTEFELGGKSYVFVSPRVFHAGKNLTAAEIIADEALLSEFVSEGLLVREC